MNEDEERQRRAVDLRKRTEWLGTQIDVLVSNFEKEAGVKVTKIEASAIDCTAIGDTVPSFYRYPTRITFHDPKGKP